MGYNDRGAGITRFLGIPEMDAELAECPRTDRIREYHTMIPGAATKHRALDDRPSSK